MACRNPELSSNHHCSPFWGILAPGTAPGPFRCLPDGLFSSFSFFDYRYLPHSLHIDTFWTQGPLANVRCQWTMFELYCKDRDPLPCTLSKRYALPWSLCILSWIILLCWALANGKRILIKPSHLSSIIITHLALKSSICTRIEESNYKLLTRQYLTPSALCKYFTEASDLCWRCPEEHGTLLHIFWPFWNLNSIGRRCRRSLNNSRTSQYRRIQPVCSTSHKCRLRHTKKKNQ